EDARNELDVVNDLGMVLRIWVEVPEKPFLNVGVPEGGFRRHFQPPVDEFVLPPWLEGGFEVLLQRQWSPSVGWCKVQLRLHQAILLPLTIPFSDRPTQGADAVNEDLTRLDEPPGPGRREFIAGAVAAGFALAAQPISA